MFTFFDQLIDNRLYDVSFLIPNRTVITTMWIQRQDGNARHRKQEVCTQGALQQSKFQFYTLRSDGRSNFTQWQMRRH